MDPELHTALCEAKCNHDWLGVELVSAMRGHEDVRGHFLAQVEHYLARLNTDVAAARTAFDAARSAELIAREDVEEERRANGQFGVGA